MLARLLYFIPGVNGCSEVMLQALGLHDRFIGPGGRLAAWVAREWESGPEGLNGCLVASGSNRTPEYAPETQTWLRVECPGKKPGFYFVGTESNQNRPGPDDLSYPMMIDGYLVRLGDGHFWYVPLVLKWNQTNCEHTSALPQQLVRRMVDGRPRLVKETQRVYQHLQEIGERAWNSFLNSTPVPVDQVFADVTALLAANYRIGADVVDLLGLLNEEVVHAVLASAIDMPSLQAQAEEFREQGIIPGYQRDDSDEMASGAEVNRG